MRTDSKVAPGRSSIKPARPGGQQGVVQRGNPALRELLQLRGRHVAEAHVVAPQPQERFVVEQDRHSVTGEPYVDLDGVRPARERGADRSQGVLTDTVGIAAVADGSQSAHVPIVGGAL